jgi:nucleotide-binding universal stress UspA family protein
MEVAMTSYQPRTILCPIDFSELATQALQYAKRLASCWDARLVVLYADTFLPPPYFTAEETKDIAKSLEQSKQAARKHLDRYVEDQLGQGIRAESRLVESLPVPAILDTAEQEKADLIVMGTHGRSGLSRLMMGSVAERVLRETHIPVLTVRQGDGSSKPAGKSTHEILCPVNYTELSRTALEYAVSLAACSGAIVRVVHVVEPGHPSEEQGEKEKLVAWIPRELRERCAVTEQVLEGNAAEQVLAAAAASGSELIVIGGQHQRFSDTTVIGTTTVRVTRHAPCPVLTVIH